MHARRKIFARHVGISLGLDPGSGWLREYGLVRAWVQTYGAGDAERAGRAHGNIPDLTASGYARSGGSLTQKSSVVRKLRLPCHPLRRLSRMASPVAARSRSRASRSVAVADADPVAVVPSAVCPRRGPQSTQATTPSCRYGRCG